MQVLESAQADFVNSDRGFNPAQHTQQIRLGHGVVQVPAGFNHPVRTAERAAALDIMSNGRLEFGTGRSITLEELGGFNIPLEDSRPMWREAVELIPKLWTSNGPVTFEGTYTTLIDREVFPKPIQKPHPPMWAAATSPSSYTLAGELGLGVLGFGTGIGADSVARRVGEYRDALARATPVGAVNENVGLFMITYCAPTDAEARQVAEGPAMAYLDKTMEHFLQWGRGGDLPPGYEWYAEASRRSEKIAEHMKFGYLYDHGMILVGSPETICANIKRYQDAGVTQILTGTQFCGMSHENALASLRLFAQAVIPEFDEVPTLAAMP